GTADAECRPRHRCRPDKKRRRVDRRNRRQRASVRRRSPRDRRPFDGPHARHRGRTRRPRRARRRQRQRRGASTLHGGRRRRHRRLHRRRRLARPEGHSRAGRSDQGRQGRHGDRLARQGRQRRAARDARAVHPLHRVADHHARHQLPVRRAPHRQPERLPRDPPRGGAQARSEVQPHDDRAGNADAGAQARLPRGRSADARGRAPLGHVQGQRLEALGGLPLVVLPQHRVSQSLRARLWLLLIVAAGGFLRFYNLAWGAPYYHFHIDEHVVFAGADMMTRSMDEAAMSPKFFMYSPRPMYLLLVVRKIYETVARHPLVLNVPRDEVVFMVMGRAIAATMGTATIPVVYAIARRVSGTRAGLLAAALTAFGVMHLRESHFFTVDIPMTFFSVVTLYALMRVLERGISWRRDLAVGASFAAALLCKYTAVFLAPVIGLAYILSGPITRRD